MISYQPLYKHLDLSADEIKTRRVNDIFSDDIHSNF